MNKVLYHNPFVIVIMETSIAVFEIITLLVILGVYIALCLIPVSMAKKRGRSGSGWFIFSFLLSPILGIIIVACLGETEDKRRERIYEEEEMRRQIRRSDD